MRSVASAPGKVILFGEHFVVYGVKAILCAIDRRVTATSQFTEDRKVRIRSKMGNVEFDLDRRAGADKATDGFMMPFLHTALQALKEHNGRKGVEISIESEIPAGVGLGSSSAACVAATASVRGLFEKEPRQEILRQAIESERTIFEDASGADSSVSTFGGMISYSGGRTEVIESKSSLSLIIANSGEIHITRDEVLKVRRFKNENEEAFARMCTCESILVEKALRSIKRNNLTELGALMLENQRILEEVNISTEKLSMMVREAAKTSYGAKITGAGGGGCIISLVDESNVQITLDNLRKVGDCFVSKIDFQGLRYS